MGIKNLIKLIDKYAKNAIKYNKINNYKDKTLGIDANLMLYKMIYAIRKNGYDIKNNNIIITHIHSILQKLIAFKKFNIIPIFVWDGIPPLIKEKVLNDRKEFNKFMKNKYDNALTEDDKKKYYYMKSAITMEEIDDVKNLINLFGFSNVDAPQEADSQLAQLSKDGMIDAIVTEDMDILVFGGNKILKNFTINPKKKIAEINLDILLDNLGISQSQLIDISILIGCDYCPSIKGIGPISAYKMIKQYKNLNQMIKKDIINTNFVFDGIVNYFNNPDVIPTSRITIKNNKININKLKEFLLKFNYDQDKINKILDKINKISIR